MKLLLVKIVCTSVLFSACDFVIAATPGTCPITYPEGGVQGNDALQAVLPYKGKFTFIPDGGGFIDHDGALGIKLAWNRLKHGQLNVGGRRLDGEAPPARAYIYRPGFR